MHGNGAEAPIFNRIKKSRSFFLFMLNERRHSSE